MRPLSPSIKQLRRRWCVAAPGLAGGNGAEGANEDMPARGCSAQAVWPGDLRRQARKCLVLLFWVRSLASPHARKRSDPQAPRQQRRLSRRNHLPGPHAKAPTQSARAWPRSEASHGAHEACQQRALGTAVGLVLASVMGFPGGQALAQAVPAPAVLERYGYDPLGRLTQHIDAAGLITLYSYDAAGNLNAVTVGGPASSHVPVLRSVVPSIIRRGETKRLLISGDRLQVGSLQAPGAGLSLFNVQQADSQIQADLMAEPTAAVGLQALNFSHAQGVASVGITVAPVLPTLSVEPSPLALPPDNTARQILLRLSSTDLMAHEVQLSMSDTSKATVSPASVTIGAGLTSALVSITPQAAGFASLQLRSSTLAAASVPVFITADFRGVNTSRAPPVGLVVGSADPPPALAPASWVGAAPVGLALGPVLTRVEPSGMVVGTSQTVVVTGQRLPAGASLSVWPSSGLGVGPTTGDASGERLSAVLTAATNAVAGGRSVVVRDATGRALPFVPPSASQLVLTSGQPEILAIEPLYARPGTLVQLRVRGRHLLGARLALLPVTDLVVDPQPSIDAAGSGLSVAVYINPLAALGPRVVLITTASGSSPAEFQAANRFEVVSDILGTAGPVAAANVGVSVGSPAPTPSPTSSALFAAADLGVLVGAAADDVSPKVVVVGSSVVLNVSGVGLQAVRSISLVTPDGIAASAFSVNAEGSLLTMPITVDPAAAKTARRLVLHTASGRLAFLRDAQSSFLVAAPAPEIVASAPQVVQAGTSATLNLRGQNFRDVLAVRFEPEQGLAISTGGVPSVGADGRSLSVPVTAAASAETGPRTVIVVTAGGESTRSASPANTVQVARQLGPTVTDLSAVPVGIAVGAASPTPTPSPLLVPAALVGVLVPPPTVPVQMSPLVASAAVGVVLGGWVRALSPTSPDGFLVGATSSLTLEGLGLDAVTGLRALGPASAPASGAAGISFGAWSPNAAGTVLSVPVNVSSAVPAGRYGLAVTQTVNGVASRLVAVPPVALQFSVGALPQALESVAPIVLEQGKSYSFTVRGAGLRDVYQLSAEPPGGLAFGAVQWTSDAFGELLTSPVRIDPDAAIGSRVVRLRVPGGITSPAPLPANTITVVSPQ